MTADEMTDGGAWWARRDIFKPARIAHPDEPFHARGTGGMTACGLSLDGALVKMMQGNLDVDNDGTPMVTCTDCDPEYTGTWRRGGRDFKAAV